MDFNNSRKGIFENSLLTVDTQLLMGRNIIASLVLTLQKKNNLKFPTVVETHNAFLAQIRYPWSLKPHGFTAKSPG